jgi:omega-amidase
MLGRSRRAVHLLSMSSVAKRGLASSTAISRAPLRVGVCQIDVGADKDANILTARNALTEAASQESNLVVLPECWNSPYSTACFPEYAETVPSIGQSPCSKESPSYKMVCDVAK